MTTPITAGIDLQAAGLTVRLSVALHPAASAPSSEASTAADAAAAEAAPAPEQLALRIAAAAAPALHEAFAQAQSIVLASQCTLLEQQLTALRQQSMPEGGAA